uniref:Transposase, MuDR, MULE transposase domain protein n=1 Tax=Tanacetum cinerariifolium TaxID=118510 RepID=A0A699H1M6_TANCI|nr:transposase, MuDR, MULE transposase domain protein [Tanacetum cinerariifolium]
MKFHKNFIKNLRNKKGLLRHKKVVEEMTEKEDECKQTYEEMHRFMTSIKVDPLRQTNKGPIIVDEHFGLSAFSEFASMQGGPTTFQTHANNSFFDGAQGTPFYGQKIVLPKKRSDRAKNKVKNANLTPLNLGNAFPNENVGDDDVMFLGGRFTGNYLCYDNMDRNKVTRGQYIDCVEFLSLDPHDNYLDCYMRGYSVAGNFQSQLVPHLFRDSIDNMEQPIQVGCLSEEYMNSWIELLINNRPRNAVWTSGKTGTADRGRQLAMMNLAHEFNDTCSAKDELQKAYEECRNIPMEQRALIKKFLKIESELDYEMNSALLFKTAKLEKQIRDKISWKLNLEANYEIKLSFKLSSYDSTIDITDDSEPSTKDVNSYGLSLNLSPSDFQMSASSYKNEPHFTKPGSSFAFGYNDENAKEKNDSDAGVNENPQTMFSNWNQFMSFKPDIPETPVYKSKPMTSKHYNKESEIKEGKIFTNKKALDLAIRLKALNEAHLKGTYKGTNIVVVGMDGNNQIMPIAFGICKRETGPCWSWWISVLKECIGDNRNLLFISDRHPAIPMAVHNEFPLAFHVPDAYHKLCEAGVQRWSRAHCLLVRYNYMTSNSVESVNACSVIDRKLSVLKLAKTNRVMVQDWYYKRRQLAGSDDMSWKKTKEYTKI